MESSKTPGPPQKNDDFHNGTLQPNSSRFSSQGNGQSDTVLYFSFNQDNTCLAVGTKRGFRIFQCHPFEMICWADIGPVSIIEMQYTSNILALVGEGDNVQFSQKRLTIWDTKINGGTAEISFNSKIVKIKLNQELIVVATKDRIFIYHLDGMRIIDKLDVENHLGRIVLSPLAELNPYMVYSQSLKEGQLVVYDTRQQKQVNVVHCHKTPIMKIGISQFGNLVATSSTQGQMIRVYSIPNGDKLYTFARGLKNTTQYFLNFSNDQCFLLSSSDTGTIHVFQIEDPKNRASMTQNGQNKKSIIDETKVGTTKGAPWFSFLVPKACDDFMSAQKSYMCINSPLLSQKTNIVSMNYLNSYIYAFTNEGVFYEFEVDIEKKQFKFNFKKAFDDFFN